jgi:WD40 repeat protein
MAQCAFGNRASPWQLIYKSFSWEQPVLAAEPDGTLRYVVVGPRLSQTLVGHAAPGTSQIVCAGDGINFATISREGLVEWWQVGRGQTAAYSIEPGVRMAALCNADRQLAYALKKSLHVVEARTGRPLWRVDHPIGIHVMQTIGNQLLTVSDEVVRRFDAQSGRLLQAAPAEPHWPRLLVTSQDGRQYVTLSEDSNTLRVYDIQQMRQTAILTIPTDVREVRRMQFIDGDRRFLVYDDTSVSIVNLRTAQELLRLDVPWAGLAKSFSDDGKWVSALDGNSLLIAPLQVK